MGDILKLSDPESSLASLDIFGGGLKKKFNLISVQRWFGEKFLVVYDWVRNLKEEKTDEAVELCNQLKPLAPFLPTFQESCLQPIEID